MSLLSIDEMIAKGWGHTAKVGAFSTGEVGGGAVTILDVDRPELMIGVPAGLAIRPFYICANVQAAAIANAEEAEILVAVDSLGLWRSSGTHDDVTPSNLRTDFDKGSACTVGAAETANLTTVPGYAVTAAAAPVLDMELARKVQEMDEGSAAGYTHNAINLVYEPNYPPVLVGPCTLFVYMGGDTATISCFAIAQWVEGPLSEMIGAL